MDAHLRQFCDDNQGFIRVALGGLEQRLTLRMKAFEHRVTASFLVVDQRLIRLEGDVAEIKTHLRTLVARRPAMRPKRRR